MLPRSNTDVAFKLLTAYPWTLSSSTRCSLQVFKMHVSAVSADFTSLVKLGAHAATWLLPGPVHVISVAGSEFATGVHCVHLSDVVSLLPFVWKNPRLQPETRLSRELLQDTGPVALRTGVQSMHNTVSSIQLFDENWVELVRFASNSVERHAFASGSGAQYEPALMQVNPSAPSQDA
jgi:hypothetical protein